MSTAQSELEAVVKSVKFKKLSTALLVMPGVFAAISFPVIIVTSTRELLTTRAVSEESPEILLQSQILMWAVVLYYAYLLASLVAIYKVLSKLREHIYSSALVTYYYTRGSDYIGALYYLRDMLNRSTLPSPVTGLLLTVLTGGLAYPILLCFAEKALRTHAALEEEAFFRESRTGGYSGAAIAGDVALAILTLGAYTLYIGYRLARTFNKHVEVMHSKHPEPPIAPSPVSSEPGAWITVSGVMVLLLVFFIVSSILAYTGYYYFPQIGFGLLLSALIAKRSSEGAMSNIGAAYLLLVLLLLGGIFTGYAGYELYRDLYYENVRGLREITEYIGVKGLVALIFSNNAVLSLPSTIPYIGGITLAAGTYNAGLVLGLYSALGEISLVEAILILIAPHAVLEFLGYSLLLSASSRFGNWRKFTVLVVVGLLVLFSAAIVETALIVSQERGAPFTESLVEVVKQLTS